MYDDLVQMLGAPVGSYTLPVFIRCFIELVDILLVVGDAI
jgi:hypothetical protein